MKLRNWNFLTDALWRVFISVRLTIILLVFLTVLSVIGTIVAQQGTTQVPLEKLYQPGTLRWLVAFGLTDIYHSAYFVFFLLLLAVNLISCSIERLPQVWRQAFQVAPPPVSNPTLEDWTPEAARGRKYLIARHGEGDFKSVREAKMAVLLFFQKYFRSYAVLRDREDQFQVTVEHGKYSRLGVYITHLSLLLIMFGSATGAILGFEGGMSVEEGTRQSWIQHLKGSDGGMKTMLENGVPAPGFLNLGFEVECEKFSLETYDGERPKAFRSLLNFYENDVKVHSIEISVNHPAVFKGVTFYQASYAEAGMGSVAIKVYRVARPPRPVGGAEGREPSAERPTAASIGLTDVRGAPPLVGKAPSLISETGPGNASRGMPKVASVELVDGVKTGDLYRVDGEAGFRVLAIEPNLMDLGPAARVQFYATRASKKPEEFWIFKNLPGFDFAHRRGAKLNFVLESVRPKYATGLSVARDPGVWIVWIGSLILVLALFIALYTCHSRYWVAYSETHGLTVVGWSNKLFLFEPRFEKFHEAFRKEIKI